MYNLNGVALNLDNELLEKYSELIGSNLNDTHFNDTLSRLARIMLKTESFDKAVDLYGTEIVAKKIMFGIKDELDTFYLERD